MYLVDVLALKFAEKRLETILVRLDTDCAEDLFDVICGWRGVATQAEEEVSCEVLHCVGCCCIVRRYDLNVDICR